MTKNNKLGFQLLIMPVTTVVQNITSITLKRDRIMNGENIIIHDNIDNSCLGKAGLHLNAKGTGRLTMNFL